MNLSEYLLAFQSIEGEIKQELNTPEVHFQKRQLESRIRSRLRTWPRNISSRLEEELFGIGPLTELIDDEAVSEILILGYKNIVIERNGSWHNHLDHFLSEWTFKNFVHRIFTDSGSKTDLSYAVTDGHWRGFRMHAVQAPLVNCGFHLSFRRHPRNPFTLTNLLDHGFLDEDQKSTLQNLVASKKNILVVGGTGAGKTTLLGACLRSIGPLERVVILEDTPELQEPNSISTRLLTRVEPYSQLQNYDLSDLLRQSLRMHPDRLAVGEVRGGEAKDLLMALSTGHAGSFGTLHAHSAAEALFRLEFLIQTGAPQWSLESIRRLILLTLDFILVVQKKGAHRQMEGIYKLVSLEKNGLIVEPYKTNLSRGAHQAQTLTSM